MDPLGRQALDQELSSVGKEVEFTSWLETTLAAERTAIVDRLQLLVRQQLTHHHDALLHSVEGQVSNGYVIQSDTDFSNRERPACPSQQLTTSDGLEQCKPMSEPRLPARGLMPQPDAEMEPGRYFSSAGEMIANLSMMVLHPGRKEEERQYRSSYIADLAVPRGSAAKGAISFIGSQEFELTSCLLIVLNMAVMALEVQYLGCMISSRLGEPECNDLGSEREIEMLFTAGSVIFSAIFTGELILRIIGMGCAAFRSSWLWFDAIVLAFALVDTSGRLGLTLTLGVNPTSMRAARVVRMLRMLKFLKAKESFHTLFLLLKSILASRHTLIWSVMILYFIMTCVGLMMNQALYGYLVDMAVDETERKEVFEYFGTYTRTVITMFEVTLGNWAPPSRVLMRNISQWWGVFIVIYRCVFCFSVVHVTGAVFITETSRVASDDEVQMMKKQRNDKKTAKILSELFNEMDTSQDGSVSLEELRAAAQDPVMKNLLEILEVELCDVEELYGLMENGMGRVPQQEFVNTILELRGNAKSSKQVAMMKLIRNVMSKIEEMEVQVSKISRKVNPVLVLP